MKKSIIILIVITLIPCISIGLNPFGPEKTKPVFSKIIESEGIDSYRIPTFLIRFALNFDEEGQQLMPLFNGSRFINFAISENNNVENEQSYLRLRNQLDKSSYKSLIDIVDKDAKLSIKALVDNNIIREFVILINDENSLIAISMTGKINLHEIAESIAKLNSTNLIKH